MDSVKNILSFHQEDLKKKGHYLSGVFFHCGEWFWGIDRLDHLENSLSSFGVPKLQESRNKYI